MLQDSSRAFSNDFLLKFNLKTKKRDLLKSKLDHNKIVLKMDLKMHHNKNWAYILQN